MPIDYKAKLAQDELALEELIKSRKAPDLMGQIQSKRDFSPIAGVAAGANISPMISPDIGGRLDTGLTEVLSRRQYDTSQERINLAYNRALERAQNAGMRRQEADQFARQTMQDEIRRQNEGRMNQQNRDQKVRQQMMANQASLRGESIEQAGADQEYQAALYRILTGLPSQLLSHYFLSKGTGGGSGTSTGQSSFQPNYEALNERAYTGGFS